jgi:hypothetical protein
MADIKDLRAIGKILPYRHQDAEFLYVHRNVPFKTIKPISYVMFGDLLKNVLYKGDNGSFNAGIDLKPTEIQNLDFIILLIFFR